MTSQPEEFEDSIINTLFYAAEKANFGKEKTIIYQQDAMTEKDYEHDMYYSKLEGREEGLEEGIARGKKTQALEIAKTMISKGLAKDLIVEMTGLTEEEIKSL
ncbi:MAG: hypothetical protein MJZ16_08930, partial [Bacteroidales bacterium]|nr:hypothetical protein [Bacteroidales bacterium]